MARVAPILRRRYGARRQSRPSGGRFSFRKKQHEFQIGIGQRSWAASGEAVPRYDRSPLREDEENSPLPLFILTKLF